jgi:hypothetical protein
MSELNFDATTVEPMNDFSPIPVGEYIAVITASDMKDTKSGSGKYLQLTYQIVEGEYKNRLIFENINLINSNEVAVQIAQKTLSSICHAVGVLHPQDSVELHDKPLMIKVGIRPASGEYQEQNIVKSRGPLKSSSTSSGSKKPWENK